MTNQIFGNGYYLVEFNNNKSIISADGPHTSSSECANTLQLLKLLSIANNTSTYKMIKVETVPQNSTLEIDDKVISICRRLFGGLRC